MLLRARSLVLALIALTSPAVAQRATPAKRVPATPENFIKEAEQRYNDAGVSAARASWVQETYITDDTEAISAEANNTVLATTTDLVTLAKNYERAQLSPEVKRKFWLLKLSLSAPAPKAITSGARISSSARERVESPHTVSRV